MRLWLENWDNSLAVACLRLYVYYVLWKSQSKSLNRKSVNRSQAANFMLNILDNSYTTTICQDCNQSIPLRIRSRVIQYTKKCARASATYIFGSETFNIPCSAKCGSFSLSPPLLMYSVLEVERGNPNENSTVSSDSYAPPDPQIASMTPQ